MPTRIPGVVLAGTFYQSGGWVCYDVHDAESTVIVELEHEHHRNLVIQVSNPRDVLARLQSAIAPQ